MKKTCFFIGHRDAPDTIYPALLAEVERHITEFGVGEFIVGHYGRFDSLAARAVKESKARHPEVELTLLLPYHPAKRPIQKPEGFDSLFYPPGMEKVPYKAAIVAANRYVVDHVDYLIAYAWQLGSNAYKLQEYAKKLENDGGIKVSSIVL
ncbi:hypothetical protein [Faecalibacterium sp. An192]|uniref:hypothetical protein n=1 Tax=Faecalibacterium sp. An192 TaxID=1965581 RepID=UPI000B3A346E|nr:hypothetical protein [Faecalibacterium sp. An192]OUP26188.1 hypothetical protein B5F27_14410 [Faecalibacterium sp. An192]